MNMSDVNKRVEAESGWQVYGKWNICLRPYVGSMNNILLVAMWLAWPSDKSSDRGFVALVGHPSIQGYEKGQSEIPHWSDVSTNAMSTPDELVTEVLLAKERLISFLDSV